eukprot:scaffold2048_cov204-Alexandrium_tamarense.AAC.15
MKRRCRIPSISRRWWARMWGGWDERGAMGAALTVALVADRSAPLGWALLAFMVEHKDDCFVCGKMVAFLTAKSTRLTRGKMENKELKLRTECREYE